VEESGAKSKDSGKMGVVTIFDALHRHIGRNVGLEKGGLGSRVPRLT